MKKKLFAMLLSAMLLGTLAVGCDSSSTSDSAVEAIQEAGVLIMYTDAAFPPFEYLGDSGDVYGVDVDIAQAIADELGVELQVENVVFDTIVASVQSGKADIGAAGMTITEERLEQVDFSTEYVTSVQYIIVPEDTDVTVLEDMAGFSIGVQTGTTSDFIISDEVEGVLAGTDAECVWYDNSIEAGQDLLNGRIDAVVADQLPAENIVASNDGLKCFELVYEDGSVTDESYGIAVAQDSDLLDVVNQVIDELIADGTIDASIIAHTGA